MKKQKNNMTKTNTSWDNIYTVVINLAKEKERKSFMENQLNSYGITHVFLDAINGYSYDFSYICDDSISKIKNNTILTAPEKGCALSHRLALEMFLKSEKKYGLILEDDIDISPLFKQAVIREISSNKNKWSYLQFNYSPVGIQGIALWWFLFLHDNKKRNILQLSFTIIKGIVMNIISIFWGARDAFYRLINSGRTCGIIRDQYLAGCYIVTRESAKKLIELNTPIIYTADRLQNIARRNKSIIHHVYVPRIVRQKREMFTSSINDNHFGKDVISY